MGLTIGQVIECLRALPTETLYQKWAFVSRFVKKKKKKKKKRKEKKRKSFPYFFCLLDFFFIIYFSLKKCVKLYHLPPSAKGENVLLKKKKF